MEKEIPQELVERWAGKEVEVAFVLKQVEDEYEEFNRQGMKGVKRPEIKAIQAFKYLIHMAHNKIKEIDELYGENENHTERFFLFECRDVLAHMLYIQEHPDILEDDITKDV